MACAADAAARESRGGGARAIRCRGTSSETPVGHFTRLTCGGGLPIRARIVGRRAQRRDEGNQHAWTSYGCGHGRLIVWGLAHLVSRANGHAQLKSASASMSFRAAAGCWTIAGHSRLWPPGCLAGPDQGVRRTHKSQAPVRPPRRLPWIAGYYVGGRLYWRDNALSHYYGGRYQMICHTSGVFLREWRGGQFFYTSGQQFRKYAITNVYNKTVINNIADHRRQLS